MKRFYTLLLISLLFGILTLRTEADNAKASHLKEIIDLIKQRNHSGEDTDYMEKERTLLKRSKQHDDTLSEEQRKKIDEATENAFKKLKQFYIVASRARFG